MPAVYEEVAADLARRLQRGEWKPGDQLPTKTELAVEYRVGKSTLESALTILRTRGMIHGVRGVRLFAGPEVREDERPVGMFSARS